MKIDKYRDLFSKIDTDRSYDEKIKNELLYYDLDDKHVQKSMQYKKHAERKEGLFFHVFRRVSVVGRILPSLAFLVFLVVAIVGFRIHLLSASQANDTIPGGAPYITGNPELGDTSDIIDDFAGINEAAITEIPDSIISEDTGNKEEPAAEAEKESKDVVEDKTGTIAGTTDDTDAAIEAEDFYFAWFDAVADGNVKSAIPNLVVRFHGTINSIDPSDFTDIVLTRDSIPIDNSITFTDKIEQFEWGYEDITDFYFRFTYQNSEPGIYGLTGKYKGVPFTVYSKIIETAVTDEAAHPDDLSQVSWAGNTDKEDNFIRISELAFCFNGLQNAFYQSDLTDLKVTRNNEEISCSFKDKVFRYYEVNENLVGDTSFHLILKDEITQSGTYVVTGKYQGVDFTSIEINIP